MLVQGTWSRARLACYANGTQQAPASSTLTPRQRKLAAKRKQRSSEASPVIQQEQAKQPPSRSSPPPPARPPSTDAKGKTRNKKSSSSKRTSPSSIGSAHGQSRPGSSLQAKEVTSPPSSTNEPPVQALSVFGSFSSSSFAIAHNQQLANLGLQWAEEIATSMQQCGDRLIAVALETSKGMPRQEQAAAHVSLCASVPRLWWAQLPAAHQTAALANMHALLDEALARQQIDIPSAHNRTAAPHAPGAVVSSAELEQVNQQLQDVHTHALSLSRCLPSPPATTTTITTTTTNTTTNTSSRLSQQEHVDITWAASHLVQCCGDDQLRSKVQALQAALRMPFLVLPLCLPGIDIEWFEQECQLARDVIYLEGGAKAVQEVRLTGWQSDADATFKYSGKEMQPQQGGLSPYVAQVRNVLWRLTGAWYDSVLINLYPDGRAGMRYHVDPLYGVWTPETSVVSVGVPRRFAFREIGNVHVKWQFTVRNGDVVVMFSDCQDRLQHSVITSPDVDSKRISLVYKQLIQPVQ